jgi:hypothetical protein
LAFLGCPIWWALGVNAFIWPFATSPMAIPLARLTARRGGLRVPKPFGWWLCFLGWSLLSGIRLETASDGLAFVYRAVTYLSATLLFLFVYTFRDGALHDRRVARVLAGYWVIVVVGGLLGSFVPRFGFRSLAESALPGRLAAHPFVRELVHPAAAQISTFLGYEAPRPKAPFAYANEWGAAFAVTTPLALLTLSLEPRLRRRWPLVVVGIVALIPVVLSMNRGLWLSIVVGSAYACARLAARGRARPLSAWLVVIGVGATIVWLTPLRDVVVRRLETPHSDQGRRTLYMEAISDVARSPLLGYGVPQPSDANPNLPPVGTQGQLWMVLVSHGLPGAAFYTAWLAAAWLRTRRSVEPVPFWCNLSLLMGLIQLPFYGQIAAPIHVLMVAAALGLRPSSTGPLRAGPRPEHASSAPPP